MRANDLASTSTNPTSTARTRFAWALLSVVLGASLLRIRGAQGELWLDEVWSLGFARLVHGPFDALRIAHDNNHILNTLFLACVPDSKNWWLYRALAIGSGSATVCVAAFVALRQGWPAALAAALLFAASFAMVVYGSEARGYAPCLLFALQAWREQQKVLKSTSAAPRWVFALWAVLGLAAHLTFVHFELALAAWALVHCARTDPPALALRRFAALHALPLAACAALYFGFVRRMQYGGGDAWSIRGLAEETLTWTFGLPQDWFWAAIGALALALLLAWHVRERVRQGSSEWVFTLAIVLGAPLATLVLLRPDFLAQRYFLLSIGVILILVAEALGAAWQRRGLARLLATGALCAMLAGDGLRLAPFLRDGRGRYLAALEYMSANTAADVFSVSSDSDFGTPGMLDFYGRFLPAGKRVVYVPQQEIPREGTPWFIIAGETTLAQRPARLNWSGHDYVRGPSYPYSGPSGYLWSVYQRVDR